VHDGEVARLEVARALRVEDDRHARREVRLAGEELPPARYLDY
jgi:hypothetical protein